MRGVIRDIFRQFIEELREIIKNNVEDRWMIYMNKSQIPYRKEIKHQLYALERGRILIFNINCANEEGVKFDA